jgi:hypothetical protein
MKVILAEDVTRNSFQLNIIFTLRNFYYISSFDSFSRVMRFDSDEEMQSSDERNTSVSMSNDLIMRNRSTPLMKQNLVFEL